jgi:hypothetical protein
MSYKNPRQLKTNFENPVLETIIKELDGITKKDREGQEKIQESIDAQAVLTANNMGKINVPGNEKLENQFGQITVMSDHSELKQLIKNADLKLENTLQQDKVKGKIGEYQGLLTTLDFMSKKLVSSSGLNPGEEGSLSKTTSKEAMNVLNQYNQGGENLQFIKENGQIFLSETKEDGDRLNLTEAALIVGRGEEVLKTSMPIKSYEDTAAKTITDPTIAPWKVTVNTEIPLENGGVRSVTEVKIDKGLATQELMRNGSFDWVKDKTSYVIANQIWVDRMGQETFFNPANEKHELAIKEFLVQDTMKNVIPQSQLKADQIYRPKAAKQPPAKKKEKLPAKVNYILDGLSELKDKEVGTFFNYSDTLQVKRTAKNEWSLFDTVTDANGNNSQKLVKTASDPMELRGEFGVQHPSLIVTGGGESPVENEEIFNYIDEIFN